MNWFFEIQNIWVVPFYPLAAFIMIVLGRTFSKGGPDNTPQGLFANKAVSSFLTIFATFLGLLHAVGAIQWLLAQSPEHLHAFTRNVEWLTAGNLTLSVGYTLDSMSVMMLFVVTFISMLIQIYTHGYMEHDDGYCKFFAYLALFNFSMLGLVLSTNLFQMYIFWELVGVSSYLLIGFWFKRPSAAAAAVKAFLMNRVGDFGFLIGIVGLLWAAWPFWLSQGVPLSFDQLGAAAQYIISAHGEGVLVAIACLLFMGPMAKSAQVPLHTWLPDAMEGPTPISALIHAATMVAAGVYLIGRITPLIAVPEALPAANFIIIIGTLTALIGATIALTQYDIKKALAYSTMSQLGYMVCAMGLGAAVGLDGTALAAVGFTAGLFHLFTHAFFKAMLFLCSGSVIHACEDEQDMRQMGGLWSKLPITAITYLAGTIAIAGLPLTSGFFSKDMILEGALEYSSITYWALVLTAGMTSFYMFRTFFMTFVGEYRGKAHVHHESPWMVGPLAVLAVPSLGIGYLLSGFAGDNLPVFKDYIQYTVASAHHAGAEHGAAHGGHTLMEMLTGNIAATSGMFIFGGLLLAWVFYGTKDGHKWPEKIKTACQPFYNLFANKWYFDDLYSGFVQYVYLWFANVSAAFDFNGIDGVVNWSGRTVMGTGYALKQLQSGKVQTYIAILFFGVVALSLAMYYWLL